MLVVWMDQSALRFRYVCVRKHINCFLHKSRPVQGVEDDLCSGDGMDRSSDLLIVGVAISSGCDLYDRFKGQ